MMNKLKDISNKSAFKVPDNYFEEVKRKIISSTSGYSSVTKKISSFRKLRPYLAVAASIAVLVILSYAFVHIFSSGKNKTGLPEITLNEFSENYLNDIDILTLEQSAVTIEPDVAHIDMNSKDIIDYLVLENIDFNDIYEQL